MQHGSAGRPRPAGRPRAASAVVPFAVGFLLCSLGAGLGAQEQASAAPAPATQPQGPATQPAPATQGLATVLPASTKLRCFASPLGAQFDDTLAKGTVVAVGRSDNGYRQVLLPLGPAGYVHKDFATAPEQGKVKSKGTLVSFRYRPKAGEPPTAQLDDGTELVVVGELPEWWRVRCKTIDCWLPDAELEVAATATPELQAAHAAHVAAAEQEPQEWLAAQQRQLEQQQREAEAKAALQAVGKALAAELEKPVPEQDYAPIEQQLGELRQQLPEGSPLLPDLAVVEKRIKERKWVVEAMAAAKAEPQPLKDPPQVAPEVHDPLEAFHAIGWLRWERGLTGPGRFLVEQGGRPLYVVTCNSARYDLAMFVNCEVALIGPRRRPELESLRVLDAEKIEVLSAVGR